MTERCNAMHPDFNVVCSRPPGHLGGHFELIQWVDEHEHAIPRPVLSKLADDLAAVGLEPFTEADLERVRS